MLVEDSLVCSLSWPTTFSGGTVMAEHPKFVQITSCMVSDVTTGQFVRELFALDEAGDVWTSRFVYKGGDKEKENWQRLEMNRS